MEFDLQIPFVEHLGMELLHKEPGHVTLALNLRPEMNNSWGVAHGGVIMSLADVGCGMAFRSAVEGAKGVATTNLTMHFLAPGRGRLICEGFLVHRGNSHGVCEALVRDESGAQVAKAVGTFMLMRSDPS